MGAPATTGAPAATGAPIIAGCGPAIGAGHKAWPASVRWVRRRRMPNSRHAATHTTTLARITE
jgi:hypothetical protein